MTSPLEPKPYRLTNSIMPYKWGKPGGISAKLARPKNDVPEAELWIGAHPKAPSALTLAPGEHTDLAQLEAAGLIDMPYLLKLLAVDSALSIQAHPSSEHAQNGFAAENAQGIPFEASERNYRDANAKPEMVVALADGFQALCGFRNLAETTELLQLLAEYSANGKTIRDFCVLLQAQPLAETIAWALTKTAKPPFSQRALLAALISAAKNSKLETAANPELVQLAGLIRTLHKDYPEDGGIIVATLLNHIMLEAGQALWLLPGTLHAYLAGYGIEVMGPSDNVLRGGLTQKYVDVPELLKIVDLQTGNAKKFLPANHGDTLHYAPEFKCRTTLPFELVKVSTGAQLANSYPMSILVVNGAFTLKCEGGTAETKTGDSFLVPPGKLEITGSGEAFIAGGQFEFLSGSGNSVGSEKEQTR